MTRKAKAEAKAEPKTKEKTKATETPKNACVTLDYIKYNCFGISLVNEKTDISFLKQKNFSQKITSMFHFIRNTELSKDYDSGRTATFYADGRPLINITQEKGDFEKQVFTVTEYNEDGTKQSAKKYSAAAAKKMIMDSFGFKTRALKECEESEFDDFEDSRNKETDCIDDFMESGTSDFYDLGYEYDLND